MATLSLSTLSWRCAASSFRFSSLALLPSSRRRVVGILASRGLGGAAFQTALDRRGRASSSSS
eukprot:CAMPEP_0172571614 /NCGR_PEP_ID=MMETSP1067-20121228/131817_1 /TAXON_ID=265564 ORGANISM="Thalassiosira punctigera, Strain Tpunct2005C2" /NCGR_SAMPLE_ID=MMETSP1067 /ASSEMBLY_ACC=CAM_ASM_000444 /LENGTH=62 /DNA_ID=CAMNT_0013363965 /DNA_START=84 /DNA_END=268 /DNA_ORIENTATION=-